ncbi:unnamed protein product [Parascedosporium putredinis]|uniref:Uncharacterized protein n=1 Tax=Parascedosporium putredinis TaxID=1442378 RepID=A0A9P1GWR2_9PEZI|nr:unnamed protein product [Parascedosporium putredinis]CAI7989090.1 unnamed protein product [Parascedosporium putredinis]
MPEYSRDPWLMGGRSQAIYCQPYVWIAQHRDTERSTVGRSSAGAGASVERQHLGAAKDIPPKQRTVSGTFPIANVRTGLQLEAAQLAHTQVDIDVGGEDEGSVAGSAAESQTFGSG